MAAAKSHNNVGGLRFSVYYGDKLEKTVTLAQDCIFLGRLLTSHLPVEDPKVSRMHAVIEVREGKEVILSDLESSNGTRVNGQPEHVLNLKTGDTIEVGDSRIEVEVLTAEDIAAMPSVVYHSGISRGLSKQIGVDTVMLDAASMEDVHVSDEDIDSVIGELEPSLSEAAKKQLSDTAETEVDSSLPGGKKKARPAKKAKSAARQVRPLRGMGTALELKVQWGEEILDVVHLDKPETITTGKDKRNTYIIPPMEAYPSTVPIISPVTENKGGGFMLGFTENMEGWVYTGDRLQSLDDLTKSPRVRSIRLDKKRVYLYPLSPSDKGMISIENLAFCFQTVRSFPVYKSPVNKVDKRPFWVGALAYAAMVGTLVMFPTPESESTVEEQVEQTAKLAKISYSRERANNLLDQLVSQELAVGSPRGVKGGKSAKGTVQRGNKRDRNVGGTRGKKGRAMSKRKLARGPAPGSNIAQALDALKSDDITRILGKTGFTGKGGGVGVASNKDKTAFLAPRLFRGVGSGLKGGGAGGKGGGGVGFGGGESVDVGGLSTSGRGGGSGGYGTVRLGKKLEVAIDYSDEDDIMIRGALDKALIERVIRRNMGQIRLCYDSKLQFSKGKGRVSGRVMIAWRIAPSGRVVRTKVLSSSIRDAVFEQCLSDRIKTWIFPEPKGGGAVRVEYPFVFRPAG